jgi:hypothetical protein
LLNRDVEGQPLGEPGSVKGNSACRRGHRLGPPALAGHGVSVSDVQQLGPEGAPGSRFIFCEDPDSNRWGVQEIKRS